MSLLRPDDWTRNPPHLVVVGNGPYASALATVLGAGLLDLEVVEREPSTNGNGTSQRLLEDLRYVFFVLDSSDSAAYAIQLHQATWRWIEKLTSAGIQHDIATLFVLPQQDSGHFKSGLATWLCVSSEDAASAGFGFWQRSGRLVELSQLMGKVQPKDLLVLRARQARDVRYATVQKLRTAVASTDSAAATGAARELCAVFDGMEYLLDTFCRPPSHAHGNLLRSWLKTTVTDSITPDWNTAKQQLDLWLK